MTSARDFLKILYRQWMKFALFVGHINSRIIFAVLYIFVLGIYAFVLQSILFFKRTPVAETSYWQKKKYVEPSLESVRRQF